VSAPRVPVSARLVPDTFPVLVSGGERGGRRWPLGQARRVSAARERAYRTIAGRRNPDAASFGLPARWSTLPPATRPGATATSPAWSAAQPRGTQRDRGKCKGIRRGWEGWPRDGERISRRNRRP